MTRESVPRRLLSVRAAGLLALVLALAACASSGGANLRQARLADEQQDYDLAVAEYTKAARARPEDRTIRLSLDRAISNAMFLTQIAVPRFAYIGRHEPD